MTLTRGDVNEAQADESARLDERGEVREVGEVPLVESLWSVKRERVDQYGKTGDRREEGRKGGWGGRVERGEGGYLGMRGGDV